MRSEVEVNLNFHCVTRVTFNRHKLNMDASRRVMSHVTVRNQIAVASWNNVVVCLIVTLFLTLRLLSGQFVCALGARLRPLLSLSPRVLTLLCASMATAADPASGTAPLHLQTVTLLIQNLTQDADKVKRENEKLRWELESVRKGQAAQDSGNEPPFARGASQQAGHTSNDAGDTTHHPAGPSTFPADSARLLALGRAQQRGHDEYEEMKRELEEYKQKYHRELHANEERIQRVVKLDAERVRLEDDGKRLRAETEGLRDQLREMEAMRRKNEDMNKTIEKLTREKEALVFQLAVSQQQVEDLAHLTDASLRQRLFEAEDEKERLRQEMHAKDMQMHSKETQLKQLRERIETMQQAVHRRRDSMSSAASVRHRSQPPVGRVPVPDTANAPPVPAMPSGSQSMSANSRTVSMAARPASMTVASPSANTQASNTHRQGMPRPSSMSAIPAEVTPRRASHRPTKSQHSPGTSKASPAGTSKTSPGTSKHTLATSGRPSHARPLAELLGINKDKERSVKEEDEVIELDSELSDMEEDETETGKGKGKEAGPSAQAGTGKGVQAESGKGKQREVENAKGKRAQRV